MRKSKIEWCDQTWNPVTGCKHGCEYCYARKIANRFGIQTENTYPVEIYNKLYNPYPFGFSPTFHRYRLEEPQRIKKPQNIFVCSMADLFGKWIPDEWIEKVFEACEKAPQHRYLFLTKNPVRYEKFINRYMPANMWFGASQTKPGGICFNTHHSWNTFISIEPLLEDLQVFNPIGINWVIIGAETGNRKGKVIPKREWIENIVEQCKAKNIPVFMKNSLASVWGKPLIQEYPWDNSIKQDGE